MCSNRSSTTRLAFAFLLLLLLHFLLFILSPPRVLQPLDVPDQRKVRVQILQAEGLTAPGDRTTNARRHPRPPRLAILLDVLLNRLLLKRMRARAVADGRPHLHQAERALCAQLDPD